MEDRKTQTRRTRGLEGLNNHYFQSLVHHASGHFTFVENGNYSPRSEDVKVAKSPYGKPGDMLWVREAWNYDIIDRLTESEFHIATGINCAFVYRAENPKGIDESRPELGKMKWKPSIHIPKAACRIWMMVEEIRVERVQDISEEDAIAEGCKMDPDGFPSLLPDKSGIGEIGWDDAKEWFTWLWEEINGEESYDKNPWVWVVKFRVLSKTGRPSEEAIQAAYAEVVGEEVTSV